MSRTHVPAWKRLGLKLKYVKEESQSNNQTELNGTAEPPSKKRRVADAQTSKSALSPEIPRHDIPSVETAAKSQQSKAKKQVSFTTDTKATDGDTAVSVIPSEVIEEAFPKANVKKGKKTKQPTQPAAAKSQTTLDYLTEFYTSHSTWKFNKNREVWILKHALSTQDIPSAYNLMLAQYIHGLKSQNTRTRLRQECIAAGGHQYESEIAQEATEALDSFPGQNHEAESIVSQDLIKVPRPRLIMWALDPSAKDVGIQQAAQETTTSVPEKATTQKKRKNRTAVVDYSSSSSSESDSESSAVSDTTTSDSDSDSDSDSE